VSNVTGSDDKADNLAQSADDVVTAQLINQLRHSLDAILQRQHRGVCVDDWFDRARSVGHLPRFDAENDKLGVANFFDVVSRFRGIYDEVATRTIDLQAVRFDRAQVFTTRNKRNVLSGLCQPAAEVSAYATRSKNNYSHLLSCFAQFQCFNRGHNSGKGCFKPRQMKIV
jgi:hypothetical protein